VRTRIVDYYKNRIDYLFTPEAKDICNPQNKRIIQRMYLSPEESTDEDAPQTFQK
jgi:long-chain acyl-CoA synthetase